MTFGLTIEKLLLIGLIAVLIIGPERLPAAAESLRRAIQQVRSLARTAQERVREELGPEVADVDWQRLDPRQYDPRRIIREALLTEPDAPAAITAAPPVPAAVTAEASPETAAAETPPSPPPLPKRSPAEVPLSPPAPREPAPVARAPQPEAMSSVPVGAEPVASEDRPREA